MARSLGTRSTRDRWDWLPRRGRRSLRRQLQHAHRDETHRYRARTISRLRSAAQDGALVMSARVTAGPVPVSEILVDGGLTIVAAPVTSAAVGWIDRALRSHPVTLAGADHPGPFYALYFRHGSELLPLLAGQVRLVDGDSPAGRPPVRLPGRLPLGG